MQEERLPKKEHENKDYLEENNCMEWGKVHRAIQT